MCYKTLRQKKIQFRRLPRATMIYHFKHLLNRSNGIRLAELAEINWPYVFVTLSLKQSFKRYDPIWCNIVFFCCKNKSRALCRQNNQITSKKKGTCFNLNNVSSHPITLFPTFYVILLGQFTCKVWIFCDNGEFLLIYKNDLTTRYTCVWIFIFLNICTYLF